MWSNDVNDIIENSIRTGNEETNLKITLKLRHVFVKLTTTGDDD